MGWRECFMFSKSKKLTPEQIQEQLKDYTELLEVYSTVFIACKSEVLRDFSINGNNLKKGTNGLVLAYESDMEYLKEELKKLPKETQNDLELKDISFFIEDYEYYMKDSNIDKDDENSEAEDMVYKHRPNVKEIKIKNEEEKTMNNLNVKVEFKEVNKENSNLKGFADITLAGVTVKNVAIKEIQTKKGTLITFDAPNIDKYEDKEGAMHYIKSVTFNEDKQGLMTEIRKAIIEAINSTETNEYGKKVVTHETKIEYDKDFVKSYVRPLTFENNPYLKAQSKVYVGGVLSINNVNLAQGVSKDGKDFEAINFPETKVEKDGNTSYKPLVYADKELMPKIKDSVISEYNKEQEQNKSEEESEEDEIE